ncbi:GNAT family N-acetyltransferase [Tundrisphaera lichenicola]|uniref:GNAT family N-acetyltransferase n=1 Tax=Tundrisphaera lichenicola TaxID=2029860 RepID=UPI003EBC4824
MAHDIRPTTADDLPELGRFLVEGFHSPEDSAFAATEVLRWKYFDPIGEDSCEMERSLLARDQETGRIVGHLGVYPGRIRGPGLPTEGVSTLHMIDWLADRSASGVGATLMRRAHRSTETQYVLGGSEAARSVISRAGYNLFGSVTMHQRVLRAGYRWKVPGPGPVGRGLRAARDAGRILAGSIPPPACPISLQPVPSFGREIEPILASTAERAIFSSRGADRLNHLLRYPRGGITGWHLHGEGRIRGIALLAVVPRPGRVLVGKVVELMLDDSDEPAWHGAIHALTGELGRLRADVATSVVSTEWAARAFGASGYLPAHPIEFRLRDRSQLIPPASTIHLSMTEADYAYT